MSNETIATYINDIADQKTRRAVQAVFDNLGSLIADDSIKQESLDRDYTLEEFENCPVAARKDIGGSPAGTAGDENLLIFDDNIFEYHILGTQTILAPVRSATGLNIGMDQTADDGVEITQGILANSRSAFVVGTSKAFCLKVEIAIPDVTGTDDCAVGFRKVEAYQANIDDYDELAAINIISGAISTETILNGGATTTTDTTDTFADAAKKTLEVYVNANGVVTYKVDGVVPTVTAAFTFDDGEVVVPFIYFLNAAHLAGAVTISSYKCGLESAM